MHRKALITIAIGSVLGTALPTAYAAAQQSGAAAPQNNQPQAAASEAAYGQTHNGPNTKGADKTPIFNT